MQANLTKMRATRDTRASDNKQPAADPALPNPGMAALAPGGRALRRNLAKPCREHASALELRQPGATGQPEAKEHQSGHPAQRQPRDWGCSAHRSWSPQAVGQPGVAASHEAAVSPQATGPTLAVRPRKLLACRTRRGRHKPYARRKPHGCHKTPLPTSHMATASGGSDAPVGDSTDSTPKQPVCIAAHGRRPTPRPACRRAAPTASP